MEYLKPHRQAIARFKPVIAMAIVVALVAAGIEIGRALYRGMP